MIDIEKESLLTVSQAARSRPNRKGGKGVNPSTVFRWMFNGCRGIVLESTLIAGTRFTSEEAIERFDARINGMAEGNPSPAERQASIERAHRVCERAGI